MLLHMILLYPWQLLSTLDDLGEGSVDEFPACLEAGVEDDARLLHFQLDQQHLRLGILHLIKHLAKVIPILTETEHRAHSMADDTSLIFHLWKIWSIISYCTRIIGVGISSLID